MVEPVAVDAVLLVDAAQPFQVASGERVPDVARHGARTFGGIDVAVPLEPDGHRFQRGFFLGEVRARHATDDPAAAHQLEDDQIG